MEDQYKPDQIDATTIKNLVKEYADTVPPKLSDLDKERYEAIPRSIQERRIDPHLTKDEVGTLVDWKLSHGKFRPTLKGLVQQNTEQTVIETTREGFKAFSGSAESAKSSLNTLTKLRGIGPATASLLLSVYQPSTAPFFSDELFRWCSYEAGKGRGWDRDIKYNLKEYMQLFEFVAALRQRLSKETGRDVLAVEIEKAAYVLGKLRGVEVPDAQKASKRKVDEASDQVSRQAKQPRLPAKEATSSASQSKAKKASQGGRKASARKSTSRKA